MKYIPKTKLGIRLKESKRYRIISFSICGFAVNLLYALYNGALGIVTHSMWFISLYAYYIVLSCMRFGVVVQDRWNISTENHITRFCGIMLIVLSIILSGSVYLSLTADIATKYHEIIMITIATYTFCKVVLAIVNTVKVRKERSLLLNTVRDIGCADAAVSVLSLQRSMLVSFGYMGRDRVYMMNALTGAVVVILIIILGIKIIVNSMGKVDERK